MIRDWIDILLQVPTPQSVWTIQSQRWKSVICPRRPKHLSPLQLLSTIFLCNYHLRILESSRLTPFHDQNLSPFFSSNPALNLHIRLPIEFLPFQLLAAHRPSGGQRVEREPCHWHREWRWRRCWWFWSTGILDWNMNVRLVQQSVNGELPTVAHMSGGEFHDLISVEFNTLFWVASTIIYKKKKLQHTAAWPSWFCRTSLSSRHSSTCEKNCH